MSRPLVSVIIPNFNNAPYIGQSIESALSQTYENIEVIVVDDGSTDESLDVARRCGESITLVTQPNAGVSAARNAGISRCKGDFIAFLDSDDTWSPEKIERQMQLFAADGDVGLVHCGFVEFDDLGNTSESRLNGMSGMVAEDLLLYRSVVILAIGSSILVRRTALEKAGGFDESLKVMEDWELCYRIARHYKVGFVDEVLVRYRMHRGNSFARNPAAVERLEKDMLAAYRKVFNSETEYRHLRKRCFGRVHSILAGSYFRVGRYLDFVKHAGMSVLYSPSSVGRYVAFPLRVITRRSRPEQL